ncbi:MAG: MobP2 family relaxase [Aerococcaceae bacterium]|nr:MobP2 family relaxase [Aerococcaceae bacterium]
MTKPSSTPHIVLMTDFKLWNDTLTHNGHQRPVQYSDYVNYMEREDAKVDRALDVGLEENKARYESGERTLNYIGSRLKTDNVFNDKTHTLTTQDINQLKQAFNQAQANGSPMWRQVFSFDNQFLKDKGFLSPEGTLNAAPIKEATQKAVADFKQQMGFNDTFIWTAAIHYNTDNIHVHVAMAERESSRPIIETGKYRGQRKAKAKFKHLTRMKSKFINHLLNRDAELARQSELQREVLNASLKGLDVFKEKYLLRDLEQLLHDLPGNRKLWRYNNNAMQPFRDRIDSITLRLVYDHAQQPYEDYKRVLRDSHDTYSNVYGKPQNHYYDNKLTELRAALGNELLRQLKQFEKTGGSRHSRNERHPLKEWQPSRHTRSTSEKVTQMTVATLEKMKFNLRKTKQQYLNEFAHERMNVQREYQQNLQLEH